MTPVPMQTGISAGYLRPADGAVTLGAGVGAPRGGINWNGACYRVSGTKLVKVNADGTYSVLGDVGAGGHVTMVYSFDRLAIASGGKLYYWDGASLTLVTDADLGTVLDIEWVDGYFMSTDGTYLIVSDLSDPLSFNPLKYGSSEIDPDPIEAIVKIRNEIYAVNRYTVEVFNNIGGSLFPFQRIEGAQIQKGAIGTHCACAFAEMLAFLGGGRNASPAVYLGSNGTAQKISTPEIDRLLIDYSEQELSVVVLEAQSNQSHQHLWIRLPDRTLVYDFDASQFAGEPVWFVLTSATMGFSAYRAVDLVWCYDSWQVADTETGSFGYLTQDTARHFSQVVRWEFVASLAYNDSKGAIWHSLELVCLNGRTEFGEVPYISTSYTLDGEVWSQERVLKVGIQGGRMRRIAWFQQGMMRNWRAQRFQGDSRALLSIARLEVDLEPLSA